MANISQSVLPGPISQNCEELATSCFPPDALVRVKGGQIKTMEQVRIGDLLQSISPDGSSIYEEVYMIAHDDPHTIAAFVTLHHSDEDSGNSGVMKLTPDHYIAMGLSRAEHSMLPARALQPGMHIFSASSKYAFP
ncbi:g5314 [Coccomyxa elongata]